MLYEIHLPSDYSLRTKNALVSSLSTMISDAASRNKRLIAAGDLNGVLTSLSESYYLSGFLCGLTIVSSDELPRSETDASIAVFDESLLRLHRDLRHSLIKRSHMRAKIDKVGEIPHYLEKESQYNKSAGLAGWEDFKAKDQLIGTLRDSLFMNLNAMKKLAKKKADDYEVAEVLALFLGSCFAFGVCDSLRFTKPADFEKITKVPLNSGAEVKLIDIRQYLDALENSFVALQINDFLTEKMSKKSGKQKAEVKPAEVRPEEKPKLETSNMARFFRAATSGVI